MQGRHGIGSYKFRYLCRLVLLSTDIPGKRQIEFLLWLSFFLPSLTVVMGWMTMIDRTTVIVNQLLGKLPFIGGTEGPLHLHLLGAGLGPSRRPAGINGFSGSVRCVGAKLS